MIHKVISPWQKDVVTVFCDARQFDGWLAGLCLYPKVPQRGALICIRSFTLMMDYPSSATRGHFLSLEQTSSEIC